MKCKSEKKIKKVKDILKRFTDNFSIYDKIIYFLICVWILINVLSILMCMSEGKRKIRRKYDKKRCRRKSEGRNIIIICVLEP